VTPVHSQSDYTVLSSTARGTFHSESALTKRSRARIHSRSTHSRGSLGVLSHTSHRCVGMRYVDIWFTKAENCPAIREIRRVEVVRERLERDRLRTRSGRNLVEDRIGDQLLRGLHTNLRALASFARSEGSKDDRCAHSRASNRYARNSASRYRRGQRRGWRRGQRRRRGGRRRGRRRREGRRRGRQRARRNTFAGSIKSVLQRYHRPA
jgi:hypothetical protein